MYRVDVWVRGRWEEAKLVHGPRSLADGLLRQFGAAYRARLVRVETGRVLSHAGVVRDQASEAERLSQDLA